MIVEVLQLDGWRREYTSRARLLDGANGAPTMVGGDLHHRLGQIGGVNHVRLQQYSVAVTTASEAVWPWSEVEPQIVAVLADIFGDSVELVAAKLYPAAPLPDLYPVEVR